MLGAGGTPCAVVVLHFCSCPVLWAEHRRSRLLCCRSPMYRLAGRGTGVNLEVLLPDGWSASWPHSFQTSGGLVSSKAPCFSLSVTSALLAAPCPDLGHPVPLPPSLSAREEQSGWGARSIPFAASPGAHRRRGGRCLRLWPSPVLSLSCSLSLTE